MTAHDDHADHRRDIQGHDLHDPHGYQEPGHDVHAAEHGVGQYIAVFLALCVLTGASFFTYSPYWPFDKTVAWAFMMAVSCTKAMLVVLFFMHVKYEASWKYVLTIPASMMAIFLCIALVPDIGMRRRMYSEERAYHAAEPAPATKAAADHKDH